MLDDNQELFIPQTEETLRPAPGFRIFATQNPASYSGRSLLSKAFRNRFVLMSFDTLSFEDLSQILKIRCSLPDSRARVLIKILKKLRMMRSSEQIFQGKEGLVTVRDLLKLGRRRVEGTKEDLASESFSLLGERVRQLGAKEEIQALIHREIGTSGDVEDFYKLILSEVGRLGLKGFFEDTFFYEKRVNSKSKQFDSNEGDVLSRCLSSEGIQRTKELDRCLALVFRALKSKEPVLLVGQTGCGKTTFAQIVAKMLGVEFTALNCHKNTEVADFLGGFRPVRDHERALNIVRNWVSQQTGQENISNLALGKIADSFIKFVEEFSKKIGELDENQWKSLREDFKNIKQNPSNDDRDLKNFISNILESMRLDSELSFSEDALKIKIEELFNNFEVIFSLIKIPKKFEWVDGSLIKAVRNGGVFLVDEISLASDNVLERLNSLLESERSIFVEKSVDIWSKGKPLWDLLNISEQTNQLIQQSKHNKLFNRKTLRKVSQHMKIFI